MAGNGKVSIENATVSLARDCILRMSRETGREKGKMHTVIENVKITCHRKPKKKKSSSEQR